MHALARMTQLIARPRPYRRLRRLADPMTASVVGALFPQPRRAANIRRQVLVQRHLRLPDSRRSH